MSEPEPAPASADSWRRCGVCRAPETPGHPMKKCSRCAKVGLLVMFCSSECQRKAWEGHKAHCGLKASPEIGDDVADRYQLSYQIEKWKSVHITLLSWVMHQQWYSEPRSESAELGHVLLCIMGTGFDAESRIPGLLSPLAVPMTKADVLELFGEDMVQQCEAGPDSHAYCVSVSPLISSQSMQVECMSYHYYHTSPLLWLPCPNWKFVFENVVDAHVQSVEECSIMLRVEVARRRAWEVFMTVGNEEEWADCRMPVLERTETDSTWWRDANWIDHPQFVVWYSEQFGRHPLDTLAAKSAVVGDEFHFLRLKKWAALSAQERQSAVPRVPVTEQSWKECPEFITLYENRYGSP